MTQAGDRITKEMAITHADFRRVLRGAFGEAVDDPGGNRLAVTIDGGRLDITLGPERERQIALFRLPACTVELAFTGLSPEAAGAALARFERSFQRGGG